MGNDRYIVFEVPDGDPVIPKWIFDWRDDAQDTINLMHKETGKRYQIFKMELAGYTD